MSIRKKQVDGDPIINKKNNHKQKSAENLKKREIWQWAY